MEALILKKYSYIPPCLYNYHHSLLLNSTISSYQKKIIFAHNMQTNKYTDFIKMLILNIVLDRSNFLAKHFF